MGIETYGGCCPKCSKSMLQKWESSGSFMFDACPWCGFAYGQQAFQEEVKEKEVWEAIFEHHRVDTREELIKFLSLEECVPEEDSDFYPSIFNYEYLEVN